MGLESLGWLDDYWRENYKEEVSLDDDQFWKKYINPLKTISVDSTLLNMSANDYILMISNSKNIRDSPDKIHNGIASSFNERVALEELVSRPYKGNTVLVNSNSNYTIPSKHDFEKEN